MPSLHSLDPQERNVRLRAVGFACGPEALQTPIDVAFRHSGWQPTRARIRAGLDRSGVAQSRLDHWDGCGSDAWVLRDPENAKRLRIASATCKDRFCVPCADTRSAKIGRRIRDKVAASQITFLTLTLADSQLSLAEGLDKLIGSFRSLRQWPLWKATVAGGVAFIEIKWNEAKRRWHPHFHVIMSADYLPQKALADRWHAITGTSFIVHIKRPKNTETVIRYVTKYGSKPLDQSFVTDTDRLDEAIAALKGRHLATAFGSWRGWCLTDDDEHEKWLPVDTLSSLIRREARGDPEAIKIMEQLRCTIPMATTAEPEARAPPQLSAREASCLQDARAFAHDAVTSLHRTRSSQSKVSFSVHAAPKITKPIASLHSTSLETTVGTPF